MVPVQKVYVFVSVSKRPELRDDHRKMAPGLQGVKAERGTSPQHEIAGGAGLRSLPTPSVARSAFHTQTPLSFSSPGRIWPQSWRMSVIFISCSAHM